MAIPWITALKIIPWKDVISATPQVVKGAQKLYESVRHKSPAEPPVTASDMERLSQDPQALANRVQQLRERLVSLEQEQRASAALIQTLAEHNEKLVDTVETLRMRSRIQLRISLALIAATVVLAIMVWRL